MTDPNSVVVPPTGLSAEDTDKLEVMIRYFYRMDSETTFGYAKTLERIQAALRRRAGVVSEQGVDEAARQLVESFGGKIGTGYAMVGERELAATATIRQELERCRDLGEKTDKLESEWAAIPTGAAKGRSVYRKFEDARDDASEAAYQLIQYHGPALLALVADAERYRWLKEQGIVKAHVMTSLFKGDTRIVAELYGGNTYVIKGSVSALDAAIDRAIADKLGVGNG